MTPAAPATPGPRRPRAWSSALPLAVLLVATAASGCFDTDFHIRVANATHDDYVVHVWINGTHGSFASTGVVRAQQNDDVGRFGGRAGTDYHIDVVATSGTNATAKRVDLHVGPREIVTTAGDLHITLDPGKVTATQGSRLLN